MDDDRSSVQTVSPLGIEKTNRDEWVYDFDVHEDLRNKVRCILQFDTKTHVLNLEVEQIMTLSPTLQLSSGVVTLRDRFLRGEMTLQLITTRKRVAVLLYIDRSALKHHYCGSEA